MPGCRASFATLLVVLAAGACGAAEDTPAPGTPAQPAMGGETALADTGIALETPLVQDPAAQQPRQEQLVREVFAYRGSGRDPFMSLLRSGDVRPLLQDLRVTTITYNAQFPSNSVAVLRDTTVNRRYTVRVGDELGRLRVVEIRPREVVVVVDEFGQERQVVLTQRRRQEGQP